jgi:hypothetical protein
MSPQEVIDLFEAALKQPGWIDDKVGDQFPSAGSKNASGIALGRVWITEKTNVTPTKGRNVGSARA